MPYPDIKHPDYSSYHDTYVKNVQDALGINIARVNDLELKNFFPEVRAEIYAKNTEDKKAQTNGVPSAGVQIHSTQNQDKEAVLTNRR